MERDARHWPLRMELYLAQAWCTNAERRECATVPADLEHRTKIEMALQQIDSAIASQVRIRCVLADAGFGESTDFRDAIAARKLYYSVGVGDFARDPPPI